MSWIPAEQYVKMLNTMPILCVDIIIRNRDGLYLLVKRANHPLKDHWWVVGGRVLKGESIEQAAIRKVKEEVSLKAGTLDLIGYYEGFFSKSSFEKKTRLHTVSIVFSTFMDENQQVHLDSQSIDWKYSDKLPEEFKIHPFNKQV